MAAADANMAAADENMAAADEKCGDNKSDHNKNK
jgi:hypothetical protein